MRERIFLDVDPRGLRLPPTRLSGADPIKFTRQFSRFGINFDGMPPLIVFRDPSGVLLIWEGVTRAARFRPGLLIKVEVVKEVKQDLRQFPTVQEKLP